ncbi:MAG: hypothetical protein ACLQIB_44880, partial [Isosphaeraceae bacterium]
MNGGSRSELRRDDAGGVVLTGSKTLRIEPARVKDQPFGLRSCVDPVWQFVIRSRPHAVTPNLVSKATAPLPILSLACEAAMRLGASGV